jgi:c(7)-type cytochrome triheme protein
MEEKRRRLYLLLLLLLFLPAACSEDSLNFFFDIPQPTAEELAAEAAAEQARVEAAAKAARAAVAGAEDEDEIAETGERPAIESVRGWEQAAEMLPKDLMDEVDWMEALRQGIIDPRASIKGRGRPERKVFGFNFYLPGPDPSMDAYFPHSSHTQWLGCDSCHPKIFRTRGTEFTMDDVFAGEYCGVCHGVVAFAVDSCFRCHEDM